MNSPSPNVAIVLRELHAVRKRLGLSTEKLAGMLGVSQATMSRWMRGKGLTVDALDNMCRAMGTDLHALFEGAKAAERERLTLRQERILASDRLLSLAFFLILNGAQAETFLHDLCLEKERLMTIIDRLMRLGLVQKLSNGRIQPLVSRSVRWLPDGPLASAFEQTVLPMLLTQGLRADGAQYVSRFSLLDEAEREYLRTKFESLCDELLLSRTREIRHHADSEWSAAFMMTRAVSPSELLKWSEVKRG